MSGGVFPGGEELQRGCGSHEACGVIVGLADSLGSIRGLQK